MNPHRCVALCHFAIKAEKPKDSRYPPEITTFGDRLRVTRLDLGLREKDLAAIIGVSDDTVRFWETNRVKPSEAALFKLLEFLLTP